MMSNAVRSLAGVLLLSLVAACGMGRSGCERGEHECVHDECVDDERSACKEQRRREPAQNERAFRCVVRHERDLFPHPLF